MTYISHMSKEYMSRNAIFLVVKVYDSGNEPSDEDDLRAYKSRFGIPEDA